MATSCNSTPLLFFPPLPHPVFLYSCDFNLLVRRIDPTTCTPLPGGHGRRSVFADMRWHVGMTDYVVELRRRQCGWRARIPFKSGVGWRRRSHMLPQPHYSRAAAQQRRHYVGRVSSIPCSYHSPIWVPLPSDEQKTAFADGLHLTIIVHLCCCSCGGWCCCNLILLLNDILSVGEGLE